MSKLYGKIQLVLSSDSGVNMWDYVKKGAKIVVSVVKSGISSLATVVFPSIAFKVTASVIHSLSNDNAHSDSIHEPSASDNSSILTSWKFWLQTAGLVLVFVPVLTFKYRQLSMKKHKAEAIPLFDGETSKPSLSMATKFSSFVSIISDSLLNVLPMTLFLYETSKIFSGSRSFKIAVDSINLATFLFSTGVLAFQNYKFNLAKEKSAFTDTAASVIRHLATVASLAIHGFKIYGSKPHIMPLTTNIAFTVVGVANIPNIYNFWAKYTNLQPTIKASVFPTRESGCCKMSTKMLLSYTVMDAALMAFGLMNYLEDYLPEISNLDLHTKTLCSASLYGIFMVLWLTSYSFKYEKSGELLSAAYQRGGVSLMFKSQQRQLEAINSACVQEATNTYFHTNF